MRRALILPAVVLGLAALSAQTRPPRRNAVIFVADGMRHGSINATDTPALWSVRTDGVHFSNSHSVFPSLTMPNASAMATGHYPGDTGQFANNIFSGFPQFDTGNFGRAPGALTLSTENDLILGDLDDRFGGRYLGEPTLLELARDAGFSTAAIGKTGPAALQDVGVLAPLLKRFTDPRTIILDAATGTPDGVPVTADTAAWLKEAGLAPAPPPRSQPAGTYSTPGTLTPNVAHQQWFADAATKAILPKFRERRTPFVLVFWSGDPDQTQHAQGDSLNQLVPGVNGPTSRAAVRNADANFRQILEYVNGNPDLRDTTDIFVTADHGFSTVSRREIDAEGHRTQSYSARFSYKDVNGALLVGAGSLPNAFLAIDLAHELGLPLYDPETPVTSAQGVRVYQPVDPTVPQQTPAVRPMPSAWSGLIGGTGRITAPLDARVLVASQSIYVLDKSSATVRQIVQFLTAQDYIGGIFVNDAFGRMPGTLPMSDVRLIGRSAKLPQPSIVVNFRNFSTDPQNPEMTGVIIGGTQQQGQGNHGSLSRANTFNNMAAIGPDFKKGYVDEAPVGNADVAPTLAFLLGIRLPGGGDLSGRVLREALAGGPARARYQQKIVGSKAPQSGKSTVLMYQEAAGVRYLDEACFTAGVQPCLGR